MKYEDIKDFSQRCEEHPDHQSGMITNAMIQQRLHEEIDKLRDYIEQAEKQEPVALKVLNGEICYLSKADDQSYGMWCPVVPDKDCEHGFKNGTVFYTAPPKREWVGLTDEEVRNVYNVSDPLDMFLTEDCTRLVSNIEAKLKEKNT